MIALGIEGTAHTCGVGIVEMDENDNKKFKILADVRKVFNPECGGINPSESSNFIAENCPIAIKESLEISKLKKNEIDLVSFSKGPGLGPCLRMAATAARTFSLYNKIPLIGVNHCVAHIEIGKTLGNLSNPLIVYVSGGNTQILMLKNKRYCIFGETVDIGIGNLFDKFGRNFKLSHPCGPKIEELAKKGKNFIDLPYTVKGTSSAFSGLLTSAIKKGKEILEGKYKDLSFEDLCFSLQEVAFSMLVEISERALAHLKAEEVLLTGGVGNNKRLQEMLRLMAEEHNAKFYVPVNYCSDNGVMIALTSLKMYLAGIREKFEDTKVKQRFRTDKVEILWN
ncbi:MAG: bifunctional N(6)-L-threonylcarbamoyladenine synthase/serine/threonine protein kinase [Candidatus Altarchaeaceae archaeon]